MWTVNSFGIWTEIILAFNGIRSQSDQVYSLNWLWPISPFGFLGFRLYLHLSSLWQLDVADGFLRLTRHINVNSSGQVIWNVQVLDKMLIMTPLNLTLSTSIGALVWTLCLISAFPHLCFRLAVSEEDSTDPRLADHLVLLVGLPC